MAGYLARAAEVEGEEVVRGERERWIELGWTASRATGDDPSDQRWPSNLISVCSQAQYCTSSELHTLCTPLGRYHPFKYLGLIHAVSEDRHQLARPIRRRTFHDQFARPGLELASVVTWHSASQPPSLYGLYRLESYVQSTLATSSIVFIIDKLSVEY